MILCLVQPLTWIWYVYIFVFNVYIFESYFPDRICCCPHSGTLSTLRHNYGNKDSDSLILLMCDSNSWSYVPPTGHFTFFQLFFVKSPTRCNFTLKLQVKNSRVLLCFQANEIPWETSTNRWNPVYIDKLIFNIVCLHIFITSFALFLLKIPWHCWSFLCTFCRSKIRFNFRRNIVVLNIESLKMPWCHKFNRILSVEGKKKNPTIFLLVRRYNL